MSRFADVVAGLVFIPLCAFLPWHTGQSVLDAFELARDGVEKQAQIVRLERERGSKYGAIDWNYYLQIEERTFVWRFNEPRPVGVRLWMLELPNEPDQRMLGRRGDSAFDLLLRDAGGAFKFALMMALAGFFAAFTVLVFVLWIKYLLTPPRPRWSESF